MLWYLPLEPYKERYSCMLSSKGGWIESKLRMYNITFRRIEGSRLSRNIISTGQVLDCHNRSYYSLTQVAEVIRLLKKEVIKDGDTLYFDDFWTPGIEAIFYTADIMGIKLKIYAMLHAQSVDKYDFTYKMKSWMRHYEIGQSKYMNGIFVTSDYLLDLCTEAGLENVYFGGLPFNKDWILKKYPIKFKKERQVIYSSRFDEEKCPLLFIQMARKIKEVSGYCDYKFVMTTSASEVRSNNPDIVKELLSAHKEGIVEIKTNLSKKEYYQELQKSEFQMNTAKQDWLSWTLLEALTYGCIPIYPQFRSFPEFLPREYLYRNIDEAISIITSKAEGSIYDKRLTEVVELFDNSFLRYLRTMQLL